MKHLSEPVLLVFCLLCLGCFILGLFVMDYIAGQHMVRVGLAEYHPKTGKWQWSEVYHNIKQQQGVEE